MEVVWYRGAGAGTGVPGRHGMVPGGHLPLQGHGQEGGGEGAWSCEYRWEKVREHGHVNIGGRGCGHVNIRGRI